MTRRMRKGLAAGLCCVFIQTGGASDPAAAATEARRVERQAVEKSLSDLALQMDEGRKALIETRRAMEAFAVTFESENEQAQKLVAEMSELRKALREKDAEFRRLTLESPEYAELLAREKELADQLLTLQENHEKNTALLKTLQDEAVAPVPENPNP